MKDFTPTARQISLHGLGFIQVILEGNQRLHVWHPDLPRRSCFEHSAIHNHRFGFLSKVLVGTQVNRCYDVWGDESGQYDRISHDGPRSERGGRLSFIAERVAVRAWRDVHIEAGAVYFMAAGAYHETPNSGVVVTLMQKTIETDVHASSLITHGVEFDQSFDRFQMSDDDLWAIVNDAMRGAAA